MARVLLVDCPDSYRAALPSHTRIRTDEDETPSSGSPDLVVIGPDNHEPTVVAQRAARAYPGVDVLIAAPNAEVARVEGLLRITPFIPLRTALVPCEPHGDLEQAIRHAARRCDFRREHRRALASVAEAMPVAARQGDGSPEIPTAVPEDADTASLVRFFRFYETVKHEVAGEVSRVTGSVRVPPNPLRAQVDEVAFPTEAELSALERAAVLDGEWQPFLAQLGEVGRAHADLGLAFGDWLEISHAFRLALLARLERAPWSEREALDIVRGMEGFLLRTLREIAQAHGGEQRARLDRMAKNAEIFAAAVEFSEDAILTTTVAGVITAQNDAATRLLDSHDLVGRDLSGFAANGGNSTLTQSLELAARGTGTRALEATFRTDSGRSVEISLSVSPVFDAAQQVAGLSVIARDVTDKKRAEDSLRQSHKMEALGRLAGGIAHDFNNLLTIILGHATFMQSPLADPRTFAPDLEEIVMASERARTLTGQLLTFSRKQPLQSEPIDLREAAEATQQLLHRTLPPDIRIAVEADASVWPVQMDPGHVDQLLMNLALNARDAMPGGGALTIEVRNCSLEATTVLPRGEYVMLAVHDTGQGIPAELLPIVFDPFFTTKAPGSGTGIGLATCYSIVRQARGDIQVASEVGTGTSFRVWLPRAVSATPKVRRASDPSRLAGEESVLVVEDDPAVRAATTRALLGYGYRVSEAEDGRHALELLARTPFDLVVCDVVMPGMSGPELAAQLRRTSPNVPILFVTGYAHDDTLHSATLPEEASVLLKPFKPRELAQRVREVLDASRTGP